MRYCGKKAVTKQKRNVKYAELDENGERFHSGLVQPGAEDQTKYFGRIQYSLEYDFTEQQLIVGVMQCAELPLVERSGGKSDPYVKVYISPDLRLVQETKHVIDSQNLTFDERFYFKILYEEAGCSVCSVGLQPVHQTHQDRSVSDTTELDGL